MLDTAAVAVLCFLIVETLIVIIGNIFTIYVFWKHRHRLKRTSFLLVNLAVADLLVGFTEALAISTSQIPRQFLQQALSKTVTYYNTIPVFQATSSFASIFFLVLISLERAYALIWPLRHRVSSIKSYMYSAIFVWVAVICTCGTLSLLAVYRLVDGVSWIAAYSSIIFLCLVIICASYLIIRKTLNRRNPVLDTVHNRQITPEQNPKITKTLFTVIAASIFCWVPAIVVYCIFFLCHNCLPKSFIFLSTTLRLANSLVNPVIYSLKLSMFRQILTWKNPCTKSQLYRVN